MIDINLPFHPITVGYPEGKCVKCEVKGTYDIYEYDTGYVMYDFDNSRGLAYLLARGYVHCSSRWYFKTDKHLTNIWMDTSDVFAWGVSDGEDLPEEHIQTLYDLVKIHPTGRYIMAMLLLREMPQRPVWKQLIASGVWNLKKFIYEYQFRPNWYDMSSAQYYHKKNNEDIYALNTLSFPEWE